MLIDLNVDVHDSQRVEKKFFWFKLKFDPSNNKLKIKSDQGSAGLRQSYIFKSLP